MSDFISKEIASCKICKNNIPFFFEIKKQKVMIITTASTMQSTYMPLYNVRFVRNLLYSLFGYEGLCEEGFQHFFSDEGIYWTCYHKCYDKHFFRSVNGKYAMDEFSNDKCGKKFLKKELSMLNPELVIVMGSAVCEAVKRLKEEGSLNIAAKCYYTDFF